MTVLPQLERELLAAHERRRWRWNVRIARPGLGVGTVLATAAAVAVALAVLVLAASLAGHHAARPAATPSPSPAPSPAPVSGPPTGGVVLLKGLNSPVAYASGTCLYVARQVTPGGPAGRSELLRVDQFSGRVMARLRLGGQFEQALLADGTLWVVSSAGRSAWLWRLDPNSLKPLSKVPLPTNGRDVFGDSMAVAGGWLWAGTSGTLIRISSATGLVKGVIGLRRDDAVRVAADADGRILLISTGQAVSHVEQRDPDTGALIARSRAFNGETPLVGGIVAGRYAWISHPGGLQGSMERLDLDRLSSLPRSGVVPPSAFRSPTSLSGTNGIRARVMGGILWVTQIAGGAQRNYCADPISGRVRVRLPFLGEADLLAADSNFVYYAAHDASIVRAPIDPRCR